MFFFYYSFAGGGWGGAGKPVPAGGRFGCDFCIPDEFGGGGGDEYSETGVGMLKPDPTAPLPMSSYAHIKH